jgi:hypothetical protein
VYPGAQLGHDIVHLVAAAAEDVQGTGPFLPLTNAPRRGLSDSPQFQTPSEFESSVPSVKVRVGQLECVHRLWSTLCRGAVQVGYHCLPAAGCVLRR